MSEYKYPWVPKEYYPAVMGACRYIRETGYFNKAVSYYADLYNLDEEELAKHIRARQGAGQKAKQVTRKYGYVAIEYVHTWPDDIYLLDDCEAGIRKKQYTVKKATSIKNATDRVEYFGQNLEPINRVLRSKMFSTQSEAENKILEWKSGNGVRE